MDNPISHDKFDIISTIRYDGLLLFSEENIRINSHVKSKVSRDPTRFYMLKYHQERMLASARAFGWNTSRLEGPGAFDGLVHLLCSHLREKFHGLTLNGPLMLRIAFSADGKLSVTSEGPRPLYATLDEVPRPSRPDTVSQLYPSSLNTIADPFLSGLTYLRWRVYVTLDTVTPSLFTRHKTSNRRVYDKALAIPPKVPPDATLPNGVQLQIEVLIVNKRGEIMEGCRFTPYFRLGDKWITPAAECGGNLGTTRRWALEKGLCEEGVVKRGSVKYNDVIVLSNGAKGFQAGIVLPWSSLKTPGTVQLLHGTAQLLPGTGQLLPKARL